MRRELVRWQRMWYGVPTPLPSARQELSLADCLHEPDRVASGSLCLETCANKLVVHSMHALKVSTIQGLVSVVVAVLLALLCIITVHTRSCHLSITKSEITACIDKHVLCVMLFTVRQGAAEACD
jgi:hypothetical protein